MSGRTHLIVASIVNALIVGLLIYLTSDDDKAFAFFIFGYALLLFVNIMIWATLGKQGKAYMITTIALGILFLPLWIVATPG